MIPSVQNVVDGAAAISGEYIRVKRTVFFDFLRQLAASHPFDEQWYLDAYPDVKAGIEAGSVSSARQHYIDTGYFEGRLPGLFGFSVESYIQHNPDLRHLSRAQAVQHFINTGYGEGRRY